MKEREGISERLRWKPDGRFAQLDCEQYIHVSKYHARFLAILQSQVITWVETWRTELFQWLWYIPWGPQTIF